MAAHFSRRTIIATLAAAAAMPASLALAQTRRLSGTVLYRERIALPPEAALTVRLGVMTGTELGGRLIAEQIVSPAGQVPIAFAIEFDPAELPADARIGIDASITLADRTLFRTAEAIPLPPSDDPIEILVVSADREPAPAASPAITGLEWGVIAIDGIADLAGTQPTLTIGTDGAAAGNGGCNRFFGKATIDGALLTFSEVGSTFMACAPEAMHVERAFFDALSATQRYRLEEGVLVFEDGEGRARVRLAAGA
jgi:putative lipoprotein